MAAIIYRRPGERWTPEVYSNLRGERHGSAFADHVPSWRAMRFGFWGERFDRAEIRTEFWLNSRHKALADTFPVHGQWGCSAEFRVTVEALEPGLHQFFPITIRRPKGGPILRLDGREAGPDDFFVLNCMSVVDAVIPELSSGLVVKRMPNGRVFFSEAEDTLVVSRAAVAGRHLWHGRTEGVGEHFFISDALRDLLVERKLQGFVIRPVGEA